MWTCPKCGTKVDPTFDVCWKCGTTADGLEDPSFVPADEAMPNESPVDLDMPEGEQPIPEPLNPLSLASWSKPTRRLDLMQAEVSGRSADRGGRSGHLRRL